MIEVDDHNAARWLAVRYVPRASRGIGRTCDIPGWYIIRTCPCHRNERVCRYPYIDQAEAERVCQTLVKVST